MPYDTVDRENIQEMVREFYDLVLKDDILGPIFTKSLGDDLSGGKWHEHLNTLASFWLLMMTGVSRYQGDPFPPHAFLGPLTAESFDRWLELFEGVVNRLFVPEIASSFYKKADILAKQFRYNLSIDDDEDDWD